jgi:hypothetical protein
MHIAIMPEKQQKRPNNNNAQALESWESEGGAPASKDDSKKGQRPRDLNRITKAQPLTDHKQKPKRTGGVQKAPDRRRPSEAQDFYKVPGLGSSRGAPPVQLGA